MTPRADSARWTASSSNESSSRACSPIRRSVGALNALSRASVADQSGRLWRGSPSSMVESISMVALEPFSTMAEAVSPPCRLDSSFFSVSWRLLASVMARLKSCVRVSSRVRAVCSAARAWRSSRSRRAACLSGEPRGLSMPGPRSSTATVANRHQPTTRVAAPAIIACRQGEIDTYRTDPPLRW